MTYSYEHLSPERFQQLCQGLLVTVFPNAQCLPVGQPDGGRDAFLLGFNERPASEKIIFQVKFVRSPSDHADERKYLTEVIELETPKVKKLKEAGARAYYLLTNVAGTSHYKTGSIDRVNDTLSSELKMPAYCWWRDDLNRRIDLHSDLKWSFPK